MWCLTRAPVRATSPRVTRNDIQQIKNYLDVPRAIQLSRSPHADHAELVQYGTGKEGSQAMLLNLGVFMLAEVSKLRMLFWAGNSTPVLTMRRSLLVIGGLEAH